MFNNVIGQELSNLLFSFYKVGLRYCFYTIDINCCANALWNSPFFKMFCTIPSSADALLWLTFWCTNLISHCYLGNIASISWGWLLVVFSFLKHLSLHRPTCLFLTSFLYICYHPIFVTFIASNCYFMQVTDHIFKTFSWQLLLFPSSSLFFHPWFFDKII